MFRTRALPLSPRCPDSSARARGRRSGTHPACWPLLLLACLPTAVGCEGERSPLGSPGLEAHDAGWGRPCQRDRDCLPGACRAGICHPPGDGGLPADLGRDPVDAASDGDDTGPTIRDAAAADGAAADGGPACRYDTDCPIPFICSRRGECIPQCVEDRDCPQGQLCHHGGCRSPGGPCLEAQECLPGEVCHLRRCRPEPECMLAGDCPDGQRCLDGTCQPGGAAPDAGVEPRPDAGDDDPLCPPRPGVYGELCHCAAQCSSGLCLDTGLVGRAPSCTATCSLRDPCPGIDLCVPLGDGSQVCVTNDTGLACRGGFECLAYCLTDPATGQASCTVPCESSQGCPQGWGCGSVLTDLGVQRICLPAGAACLGAMMCAGQRCLPWQPGDSFGFCTLDCRNALDCPAGWACCAVYDPDLDGLVRVCYDGPVCPF